MPFASADRQALADALEQVGPDAPTLCAGWTARDLAAHLVVRERRPDSLPGLAVPLLRPWTERVRRRAAEGDFTTLVSLLRSGPPQWSPFALPGAERRANLVEHFVHLEDVRRAEPGWQPRELSGRHRSALWRALCRRGRLLYRRSPVGVVLVVPEGPRCRVRSGPVAVVVTGAPEELVLHAFGRGSHARVEVSGPTEAVAAFGRTPLGI
jgi:uncharacterized protein (TIGR03085 family)